MKMLEVQAGLGVGAKKFHTIFVFETKDAMDHFVNEGWEFGGEATAAATTGDKGAAYQGAASVMPGVWMYQFTDEGVALELAGKGTKYYKDDDFKLDRENRCSTPVPSRLKGLTTSSTKMSQQRSNNLIPLFDLEAATVLCPSSRS